MGGFYFFLVVDLRTLRVTMNFLSPFGRGTTSVGNPTQEHIVGQVHVHLRLMVRRGETSVPYITRRVLTGGYRGGTYKDGVLLDTRVGRTRF